MYIIQSIEVWQKWETMVSKQRQSVKIITIDLILEKEYPLLGVIMCCTSIPPEERVCHLVLLLNQLQRSIIWVNRKLTNRPRNE